MTPPELELDLRATLRTDDGALVSMRSFGLRHGPPEVIAAVARGEAVDPATYYFRTTPRFETAHPAYAFLNRLVAVASGDLVCDEQWRFFFNRPRRLGRTFSAVDDYDLFVRVWYLRDRCGHDIRVKFRGDLSNGNADDLKSCLRSSVNGRRDQE